MITRRQYHNTPNTVPVIKLFAKVVQRDHGVIIYQQYGARGTELRRVNVYLCWKIMGSSYEELAHVFNVSRFTIYKYINTGVGNYDAGNRGFMYYYHRLLQLFITNHQK